MASPLETAAPPNVSSDVAGVDGLPLYMMFPLCLKGGNKSVVEDGRDSGWVDGFPSNTYNYTRGIVYFRVQVAYTAYSS